MLCDGTQAGAEQVERRGQARFFLLKKYVWIVESFCLTGEID
jgi:hypothetical protein